MVALGRGDDKALGGFKSHIQIDRFHRVCRSFGTDNHQCLGKLSPVFRTKQLCNLREKLFASYGVGFNFFGGPILPPSTILCCIWLLLRNSFRILQLALQSSRRRDIFTCTVVSSIEKLLVVRLHPLRAPRLRARMHTTSESRE